MLECIDEMIGITSALERWHIQVAILQMQFGNIPLSSMYRRHPQILQ